jgi:predicted SprT family Zn-dependent metalloprotease
MIKNLEIKILDIATDYLEKEGYPVRIKLLHTDEGYRAGVTYFPDKYLLFINKDALQFSFEGYTYEEDEEDEEEVAIALVDTILHECIHIICWEENIGCGDGDFDFEKMLYDRDINSNYHRCSDALTMQDQIEGDKRQLEKLSKLLNISTYDLSYYLDVDKTENFYAKYYKYVKYVLGETDKIN